MAKAKKEAEQVLPAIKEQGPALQTIEDRKRQTDEIIEMATHWASRLMAVVDKCGLSKQMAGKKYLEVEGWLLISEFAHTKAVIEWVRPWLADASETILGYEARCQLFNDDGQVVGAGESSCGLDAFPCRGKQGSEKDKAAKSAAQTWAISRALRNKFSYVAKIAKFEAVPAEEMYHESHDEPASVTESRAESLITVKPKGEKTITVGQFGLAIMDYVNNDKDKAREVLMDIAGRKVLNGMTPVEIKAAYQNFENRYLSRQPGDDSDNIPEQWPDAPPTEVVK